MTSRHPPAPVLRKDAIADAVIETADIVAMVAAIHRPARDEVIAAGVEHTPDMIAAAERAHG